MAEEFDTLKTDLFGLLFTNQDKTILDISAAGYKADNLELADKSVYESSDRVQEAFKDKDGNFDLKSFDEFYNKASIVQNVLAETDYNESVKKNAKYYKENIFAPIDLRIEAPEFILILYANPYHTLESITSIGESTPSEWSYKELAQSNHILLNPREAGDNLENAQWGDSITSSPGAWWSHFLDTLVLAQWDEDGVHTDPFTGLEVKHKAGEFKTDNNGEFYYELLDGRDIYNRQVLSKMDTLTREGSWLNQYDFFDSDDLELKNGWALALKYAAYYGPMFIPGPTGVIWTAVTLLPLIVGMAGTLGKMFSDSENNLASSMEGFARSWNPLYQKTVYGLEHTWSWENMLSMIGDVWGLLAQQRWIFKYAPAIIKGSPKIMTEAGQAAKKAKIAKVKETVFNTKIANIKDIKGFSKKVASLKAVLNAEVAAELLAFTKSYLNIGRTLSLGYMTGITVNDTYGLAINEGASLKDAALLTLGYAAAEYALLRTGLGEWILPELRADRYKNKAIVKALMKNGEVELVHKKYALQISKLGEKEAKKQYTRDIFNIGKKIFKAEYTNGSHTLKATLAASAGEAIEETSEEVLADASKAVYNVVHWLNNDELKLTAFGYKDGEWNILDIIDRYGMSFIGGAIGGGLANITTNYGAIKQYNNMSSRQAILEIVYMARNNLLDLLRKTINNMEIGNKNLSTLFEEVDGQIIFKLGTKNDNQDLQAKKALLNQIDIIELTLNAHGANLSNDELLNKETLGDLRFAALQLSITAGAYLNEYNNLATELVRTQVALNNAKKGAIDTNKDGVITDKEARTARTDDNTKEEISKLEKHLDDVSKQMNDLISGKRSYDFIATSLFEMTQMGHEFGIGDFQTFAENKFKKGFNVLTDEEAQLAWKEYQLTIPTQRENIQQASEIYLNTAKRLTSLLNKIGIKSIKEMDLIRAINSVNTGLNTMLSSDNMLQVQESANNIFTVLYPTFSYEFKEKHENLLDEVKKIDDDKNLSNEEKNKLKDDLSKNFLFDYILNGELDKLISSFDFREKLPKLQSNQLLMDFSNGKLDVNENGILSHSSTSFNTLTTPNQIRERATNYIQSLNSKLDDELLSDESKSKIKEEISNVNESLKELDNLQKEYNILNDLTFPNDTEYITELVLDPEVKRNLSNIVTTLRTFVQRVQLNEEMDIELDISINIITLQNKFNEISLKYNPLLNKLNWISKNVEKADTVTSFQQDFNDFLQEMGYDKDFLSNLLTNLESLYNDTKGDLVHFQMDQKTFDDLQTAINLLLVYKTAINGARTDAAGINNYYGYNVTLNELSDKLKLKKEKLAEIDSKVADEINEDVNLTLKRLTFLNNLYKANCGLKLVHQDKIATNKDLLIYKKFKSIVQILDDDDLNSWEGINDLRAAIEAMSIHEEIYSSDKLIVPLSKQKLFTKEMIAFEDALYDFFNKNSSKLSNPKELAKLLNSKRFNFFDDNSQILDENLNNLDTASLIWYIASRAAVKASDFYYQYKETLKTPEQNGIIPITTQEMAIYMSYAAIVNGNMFTNFYNAYRYAMLEKWGKLSEITNPEEKNKKIEERKTILKKINPKITELALNKCSSEEYEKLLDIFLPIPLFENLVFVEGIPGSGKTTAVSKSVITLLKKYNPEVLNNVAVVHGVNKNSAEALRTSLNLDTKSSTIHSKEDFMKLMSSLWKLETILNGIEQVDRNRLTVGELGQLRYKDSVNKTSTPPSLILIDEVSRFSNLDLELINRYAREYGITVITMGDYDLTSAISLFESKNNKGVLMLGLERNSMIRTPKLGVSMRTDNTFKSSNLMALLKYINTEELLRPKSITLKFYDGEEGLYGDKVINYDPYNGINVNTILKEIDKLMSTLKLGQKITYVYFDTNSDIYKELSQEKYKDSVELISINDVQGHEGQYYIIEVGNLQNSSFINNIYTGMSRASQGSIILLPINSKINLVNSKTVNSSLLINDSISQKAIDAYKQKRIQLLDDLSLNGTSVKYLLKKNTILPTQLPTTETTQLPTTETNYTEEEKVLDIIDDTSPLISNEETEKKVQSAIEKKSEEKIRLQNDDILEQNDGSLSINILMHSFNTFELGVASDENGYPVQYKSTKKLNGGIRIDSVNGLIELDRKNGHGIRTTREYLQIIGRLRSVMFYGKSKNEIIEQIKNILNDYNISIDYINFAYKKSVLPSRSEIEEGSDIYHGINGKFAKSSAERTVYNGSHDTRSDEISYSSLVAIVGNNTDGDVLELPLFTLSSPLTIMQYEDGDGNKPFKEIYDRYMYLLNLKNTDGTSVYNTHQIIETIINEFRNNPKYKLLINLFKLFNYFGEMIFYHNDENWVPSKEINHGPEFVKLRGSLSLTTGFTYDSSGDWMPISRIAENPEVRVTKNIYVSRNDTGYVKKGNAFILVSYDVNLNIDLDIIEYFNKQNTESGIPKKVLLVYVKAPIASIELYILYIHNIINKENNGNFEIGRMFTSYELLKVLMQDNEFVNLVEKYISKEAVTAITDVLTRLNSATSTEEKKNILNDTANWSKFGFTNGNVKLVYLFNIVFDKLVYPISVLNKILGNFISEKNNENLRIIYNILQNSKLKITGIFYNLKINENVNEIGSYNTINTTEDYKVNGIECTINGKIDSPALSMEFSEFYDNFDIDNKVRKNDAGFFESKDNDRYINNKEKYDPLAFFAYDARQLEKNPTRENYEKFLNKYYPYRRDNNNIYNYYSNTLIKLRNLINSDAIGSIAYITNDEIRTFYSGIFTGKIEFVNDEKNNPVIKITSNDIVRIYSYEFDENNNELNTDLMDLYLIESNTDSSIIDERVKQKLYTEEDLNKFKLTFLDNGYELNKNGKFDRLDLDESMLLHYDDKLKAMINELFESTWKEDSCTPTNVIKLE